MFNELSHAGVLGMKWGKRNSGSSPSKGRQSAQSFVSGKSKKTVKQTISDSETEDLGRRIAKAYGIKLNSKGKAQSIGIETVPRLAATAFVAHWAVGTVSGLLAAGLTGKTPRWVGDIAWTTGKVVSNSPLR